MKQNKDTKEMELINSYLDHELDDQDLLVLAERLAQDESLKSEMTDMMQVKKLLCGLPDQKPPQNYILTRAMAQEARKPSLWERLFPAFRTAAVFACFGIILSFMLPLNGNLTNPAAPIEMQYSAKSVDLPAAEEPVLSQSVAESESIDPVSMALNEASDATGNTAMMNGYPSKGVRGGNPKLEYLVTAQRMLPDDRSTGAASEKLSGDEDSQLSSGISAQEEIQQMMNDSTASVSFGISTETVIRLVSILVLLISVGWILITLLKRKILI